MAETSKLLPCTKCSTNYPSTEFSSHTNPVCKKCRKEMHVKCIYCRSVFKNEGKSSNSVCPKCEKNVKAYGKPKTCMYCHIKAAFVNNKCYRCIHSEQKYGLPIICEQCKQKCAFKKMDDKEGEWKPLCWLCKLSYKRALDRTKQKLELKPSPKMLSGNGERARVEKESSATLYKEENGKVIIEDQSAVISSLKEKYLLLEKQMVQKDAKLLEKDRALTRLQAEHFTKEQEMMTANNNRKRAFDKEIESLHVTVKTLQKEIARIKKLKSVKNESTPVFNNSSH